MHERFDLEALVTEASSAKRLKPRTDLPDPEWSFWEKKNLNIHRVVALWTRGSSSPREIEIQARAAVSRRFKSAWWRGLGFGVVVDVRDVERFPDAFLPFVDGRANRSGTWQWVILVSPTRRRAAGLHNWIEGYLSPVYRGLLERLGERGFAVESGRKEKDGMMKLLTAAKPRLFPHFRNDVGSA